MGLAPPYQPAAVLLLLRRAGRVRPRGRGLPPEGRGAGWGRAVGQGLPEGRGRAAGAGPGGKAVGWGPEAGLEVARLALPDSGSWEGKEVLKRGSRFPQPLGAVRSP